MASLADLERAYLLSRLGLSSSTLSNADLETLLYANPTSLKKVFSSQYTQDDSRHASSTLTVTLNRLYFVPFDLLTGASISGMGVEVATLGATSIGRMGIFSMSTTTGAPGSLVAECSSTVDQSTTGIKEASFSSTQTLTSGRYYLVHVTQTAVCDLSGKAANNSNGFTHSSIPSNSAGYLYQSNVSGALSTASPASITAATSTGPRLWVKGA